MKHLTFVLVCLCSIYVVAQNRTASDPVAISFAQRSVAAMTGGLAIRDVSLSGTVTFILGSDATNGTGTMQAKGTSESRVDLNLGNGKTRSDVRNIANGSAGGAWKKDTNAPVRYAAHNCRTDAAWFFPALSSLTQTENPQLTFKYIGQVRHAGVSAQRIRVYRASSAPLFQHLSTIDFYLDPATLLPLAIAYQLHPDKDAGKDIPTEVQFADYQQVDGIQVPFRIQQMLNGGVILDITITSADFNSGLLDSTFSLQ